MQEATEGGNWIYGFFFLALFVLLLDRLCGVTVKRKEAGK